LKALELLTGKLRGSFISQFGVADAWRLYFGGYWLIAQDVISADEHLLNQWLHEHNPPSQNAVDKEYVSKCAIVAAHLRKEVTGLQLDDDCNLTIEFEHDGKLLIPTDVKIVDWQWCLNESGSDPYSDYLVACFWQGKIVMNEDSIENTN
jgi:hypothetical protein